MTTIAYRDGIIAADTYLTGGSLQTSQMTKIARVPGALAGACGLATFVQSFLDWFKNGREGRWPNPSKEDAAFIVPRKGGIICFEKSGIFEDRSKYIAIGSGAGVAIGAMFIGATAKEALKAAIRHDAYTGGRIETLELG